MTSRTSSPPSLPKTMSAKCSDSYHQLSKKLKATLPSRERHIPDPTTIVSILTKTGIHWQTWTSKENKTGWWSIRMPFKPHPIPKPTLSFKMESRMKIYKYWIIAIQELKVIPICKICIKIKDFLFFPVLVIGKGHKICHNSSKSVLKIYKVRLKCSPLILRTRVSITQTKIFSLYQWQNCNIGLLKMIFIIYSD